MDNLAPLQAQVLRLAGSGYTAERIGTELGLPRPIVDEAIVDLVRRGFIARGEATPCASGGCGVAASGQAPPACAGCPISKSGKTSLGLPRLRRG